MRFGHYGLRRTFTLLADDEREVAPYRRWMPYSLLGAARLPSHRFQTFCGTLGGKPYVFMGKPQRDEYECPWQHGTYSLVLGSDDIEDMPPSIIGPATKLLGRKPRSRISIMGLDLVLPVTAKPEDFPELPAHQAEGDRMVTEICEKFADIFGPAVLSDHTDQPPRPCGVIARQPGRPGVARGGWRQMFG